MLPACSQVSGIEAKNSMFAWMRCLLGNATQHFGMRAKFKAASIASSL
jgi:hypothetical protein